MALLTGWVPMQGATSRHSDLPVGGVGVSGARDHSHSSEGTDRHRGTRKFRSEVAITCGLRISRSKPESTGRRLARS